MHTYKMHAHEVYSREIHAREMYAHKTHAYAMHVCEVRVHEVYPHEIHTHETPAHPFLWRLSGPNSGRFMHRHLSFKKRVFALAAVCPSITQQTEGGMCW